MPASYVVCAIPRSGSTLLCEALKATGVAGRPEEYFEAVAATGRPPRPQDYLAGLEDAEALALLGGAEAPEAPPYSSLAGIDTYGDHLERVRRWGTTPNGVFGAKLMWDHLTQLQDLLASRSPLELLDELFDRPRLIWVRREDVVRQAVSLWRAMQTQSWRDDSSGAAPGQAEPQYSFAALRHLVARLTEHDARWAALLARARSRVLEIGYEQLTADLPAMLRRALDHIGVAPPGDRPVAAPGMRRQADELSEAWVARYAHDADRLPTGV